ESTYYTLVLNLLGSSLHNLFLANNQKFTLHTVINLVDQLLLHLEYIYPHNYVHGDIKLQNVMVGLHDLRHTAFIINFSIMKEYCNTSTRLHIPFHHNQCLTGTPAFTSINNHLGVEPGCCDDLESLTYMLIYFLYGSLPWLTNDHEKLSSSSMLECKANTTIKVLCHGIPVEFTTMLIYICSLAFSEDPNYDYLHSLLHGICTTLPVSMMDLLDFSQSNDPITSSPPFSDKCLVAKAATSCLLKAIPPHRLTHV
ncbi:kinase-like domain-containing protein, partial [Suillus subluteus]